MKKVLFSLLSASALLCSTSCSEEAVVPAVAEDAVSFSVALDGANGSRAINDGLNATELYYEVYATTGSGENLTVADAPLATYDVKKEGFNGKANINLALVKGQTYYIVFWAQAPGAYNASNLRAIDVNEVYTNAAAKDAFTAVQKFTVGNQKSFDITLKRPFAQINFGTADAELAEKAGVTFSTSIVEEYETATFATQYDALAEVGSKVEAIEFIEGELLSDALTVAGTNYKYLAAAYVLLPDYERAIANVKMTIETGLNKTVVVEVPNAPVQRNYRTNVIGNLLTENTNFDIVLDANFNENEHAVVLSGNVTLNEDLKLNSPLIVPAGEVAVLNLNGHNIIATEKQEGRHHYAIDNYGTLTIKGEGAINARGVENFGTMTIDGNVTITNVDTNGGAAIWNEGNIVINGGTFTTNAEAGEGSYGGALSTQEGATAVINGGTFVANSQLTYAICNYGETTINDATVKGKHGAVAAAEGANIKTVINGGTFSLMENPAVSDHCVYYVSDIKGGSFTLGKNTDSGAQVFYKSTIAEGYVAIQKDGVYVVYPGVVAEDKATFEAAIANADLDAIRLETALSYASNEAISIENDLYIAAQGKTITAGGAASLTPSVAVMGEYNVTLDNANVVGGFYGAYYGANLTVDGGSLKYTDGQSGRNCFYAASTNEKPSIITIKDVDVNMANASGNSYLCAHGNAIIYVEGGNFYGKPVGSSHAYVKEIAIGSYTGQVIISGGTFNFDPTEWVAEGYKAVKNGNVWTVSAE